MTLLICRTCPRYDPRRTGEFGDALTAAIAARPAGRGIALRSVQCLGGCPQDGVVAVDGPGKARVRFTGVTLSDADAVIAAAAAHETSRSGDPAQWAVPAELAARVSTVTFKRLPLSP